MLTKVIKVHVEKTQCILKVYTSFRSSFVVFWEGIVQGPFSLTLFNFTANMEK